jgi:hypothetical protein
MTRSVQFTLAVSLAAAMSGAAATLTADQGRTTVQVRDDCDPATFNADPPAGVGPGTCVGDGDTTFPDFIAEVSARQSAEKWRFNPDRVSEPRPLVATNRGGEVHTFTKVQKFGGGVVDILNQLSGNPVPAPECLDPSVFDPTSNTHSVVPPGGSVNAQPDNGKTTLYQCCIHPWMRTTVRAR